MEQSDGALYVVVCAEKSKQFVSRKADLANEGGPSSPCDAPAKVHNEDSIQYNIDPIADDGSPQGGLGVSQTPKHPLQFGS